MIGHLDRDDGAEAYGLMMRLVHGHGITDLITPW